MVILGIDPGTATTGWGIIKDSIASLQNDKEAGERNNKGIKLVEYGCVKTLPEMEMHYRLLLLRDEVAKVIKKHKPDIIVVERIFFNTNAKTAMSVGQARGVIMLLAAEYKLDFFEYTALQAKKELSGYGRCDKKEMQEATRKYLGLKDKIKPDDAADALALAILHFVKCS